MFFTLVYYLIVFTEDTSELARHASPVGIATVLNQPVARSSDPFQTDIFPAVPIGFHNDSRVPCPLAMIQ